MKSDVKTSSIPIVDADFLVLLDQYIVLFAKGLDRFQNFRGHLRGEGCDEIIFMCDCALLYLKSVMNIEGACRSADRFNNCLLRLLQYMLRSASNGVVSYSKIPLVSESLRLMLCSVLTWDKRL